MLSTTVRLTLELPRKVPSLGETFSFDRKCPGTGQSSGIFTSANKAPRADHETMSDNLVTYSNAITRDTSRLGPPAQERRFVASAHWYKVAELLVLFDHGDVAGELRILDRLR
jgi:hypothetical protein